MAKNKKQYAAIFYRKCSWDNEIKMKAEKFFHLYTVRQPFIWDNIESAKDMCRYLKELIDNRRATKELERLIAGEPIDQAGDTDLIIGYKIYNNPTDIEAFIDSSDAENGVISSFDDDEERE